MNSETKNCQNCKQNFTVEPDDFDFYEKLKVPAPTFCPECREIFRIAFRNERALYKRKCDKCGKVVVSRVSPDKPYPMYCKECWWGDGWDAMEYGREYDFSRPFFAQFKDLLFAVPAVSLLSHNVVNSDWVNQETDAKSCYLNVGGHFNEGCGYTTYAFKSHDCFDNFWIISGDKCCGNIMCERVYHVSFSEDCHDCRDVYLAFNCRNCSNCFGCAGLRNKQYCLWNEEVGKEAYENFLKTRPLASYTALSENLNKAQEIWNASPHKALSIVKSADVSGNCIANSKNSHNVWSAEDIENSKHQYIVVWLKECMDGSCYGWCELCYQCASSVGLYSCKGVMFALGSNAEKMHSSELEYCHTVVSCHNCFGCVGVRNKQYCIFNKQYTKEEYEEKRKKIIEHMAEMPYVDKKGRKHVYGDSFPIEISNYGYNETVTMDYYPLTKEEAIERGYPWCDYEAETNAEFSEYAIPDDIKDVGDDILEKVLKCEVSGKPYRIIPMELQFYRQMNISIPRKSPLVRHKERMARLLPRKFFPRTCACNGSEPTTSGYKNTVKHAHVEGSCGSKFETAYSTEREETIYCEACYQAEIA